MFKKVGGAAVRLLLFPGIVEALVSGAVGIAVFKMPALLAFAMGFILKVCLLAWLAISVLTAEVLLPEDSAADQKTQALLQCGACYKAQLAPCTLGRFCR